MLATGNLRAMAVSAYRWMADRDVSGRQQAARLAAVVGAFVAGAVLGGVSTNRYGTPAVAIAAGLLFLTLAILIRETRQLERAAGRTGEQPGPGAVSS